MPTQAELHARAAQELEGWQWVTRSNRVSRLLVSPESIECVNNHSLHNDGYEAWIPATGEEELAEPIMEPPAYSTDLNAARRLELALGERGLLPDYFNALAPLAANGVWDGWPGAMVLADAATRFRAVCAVMGWEETNG